jgi:uncharacterized protein YprB with RNaseH-like and TPR domain
MVAPDRERLRRAFGVSTGRAGPPAPAAPGEPGADRADLRAFLRRRTDGFLREPSPVRPPVALPPGEVARNELGPFWRRELRYPAAHRHGEVELGRARDADGGRLAALARDPRFQTFDLTRCLCVDTETTGLSGGAGTVVFAIGLGWFDADAFVFEQLFLREFGEEPALLQHIADRLRERPLPVTFVGKSFDRHRIAARLCVHRLSAPILTDEHLDLYHLARRAWGKELPDCRLRTVEEHRLGLVRDCDLPGSEAPAAFLQWLRDGTGPVDRVLEHNRLDVLSVAALLGVLGARAPDDRRP